MGILKQKTLFTFQKQMKVFTYLALLGGAAAIRLMSTHQPLIQQTPMRNVLVQLNQSEDWPELTEEQMKEIEDWVKRKTEKARKEKERKERKEIRKERKEIRNETKEIRKETK